MRITITNDDGEVYATLRDVQLRSGGQSRAIDDDGEEVRLDSALDDAAIWERRQRMHTVYPKGQEPGEHKGYTVGLDR